MTTLDISVNKLVGGISILCDAQLLKNLLSGRIPSCLSNLEELRSLNLADNSLEGEIPSSLGDLQIRFLHLQKNYLQGKIPSSLRNLTSLQRLDLGKNKLKDVFPTWIGEKLQSLELLRLNSNQFYGVIPLELCQISSLCWPNLAGNNLYGTIPRCFSNFSCMNSGAMYGPGEVFGQRVESFMKGIALEYVGEQILLLRILDLSDNKFVGRIPNELTKLVDLQYLNLSRNNLNGSIPKKIGDLKQLESLDLSHNKLSGSIPQSLASLNYLSYMNLSYNDFSGPIPTGNQLQSLDDKSFYVGNPRLCGKLIKKSCNGNGSSNASEQIPQGDHQDDDEHKWFYAGIVPGFCVGFLDAHQLSLALQKYHVLQREKMFTGYDLSRPEKLCTGCVRSLVGLSDKEGATVSAALVMQLRLRTSFGFVLSVLPDRDASCWISREILANRLYEPSLPQNEKGHSKPETRTLKSTKQW
ncbi:hypothetical protein CQW23_25099 [Capsicum baccatum]|uniref:Disease resistance R13L4/SHOC-2-like LRR domain-containing protein n=1 Tax=Capsicum baccatum TaxID=33114 RepID=A0A2G2VK11_CAPBA|nr:hypothetical protein CQW23_25099 [Capsicum baccatum]